MKICLIGEFSGLHMYLKQGLQELGHDVILAADGDGYKKIPGSDMSLLKAGQPGWFGFYDNYVHPFVTAAKIREYDVVQYISPVVYPYRIRKMAYEYLMRNNNCNSLVAAGSDLALVNAYESGAFDYYIYDQDKAYIDRYRYGSRESKFASKIEENLVGKMDVIIPSLYEYSVGYKNHKNIYTVIPFPINCERIEYNENHPKEKIVFFHGLNKEKKKGTEFILKAFELLQKKYPNEVEVIAKGHIPLNEYMDVMSKANVVVDQCLSYGYGINACLAMAQGKVVISGCRKETLNAFGIEQTPMLLATPSVEQLFKQMCYLVENRNKISEIGYESRKYVEHIHNYVDIAKMYVYAWKSTGKV